MERDGESRATLIALVDEVHRLGGRLKGAFAEVRRAVDLGESELMVLNAVVEAGRPPTVSQIGRSLGQPRQIVQRAANALVAAGLISTRANPDHKRAPLLLASPAGLALKRQADDRADTIAASLAGGLDEESIQAAVGALRTLRRQLEAHVRAEEG